MPMTKPPVDGERLSQNQRFVGDEIYKECTKLPRLIQAPNNPAHSPPNQFVRSWPGSWQHVSAALQHVVGSLHIVDAGVAS